MAEPLKSPALGKGTCARVFLPADKAMKDAASVGTQERWPVCSSSALLPFCPARCLRYSSIEPQRICTLLASFLLLDRSTMRILIVDDENTFCQLLTELLEDKGHEVEWTSHGLDGYKMSQRKYYDLFIFDVRMPVVLGTELAEGLKEQSPGTKIILVSAFPDEPLRSAARSLGIPLLSKPFTTETFLDLVERTGAVKSQ